MKKKIARIFILIFAVAALLQTTNAQAGIYWPSYWYLDGYITFQRTSVSVTVPTGYYRGVPYWPLNPVFGTYPWLGGRYLYGFTDSLTYTSSLVVPRATYWLSWYWDPAGVGHTLDIIVEGDELTGEILPLGFDLGGDIAISSHTYEINDGIDSGDFSKIEMAEVGQNGIGLRNSVQILTGMDSSTLDAFMNSPIIASLLSNSVAISRIGLTYSGEYKFPTPEPGTIILVGLGLVGLVRLKRGAKRRSQVLSRSEG
jgi:PEP-CTERM motif